MTMEKPQFDPEERMFTVADVKRLYIANRKRLIRWAVLGAICTFLLCGLRPIKYKIEATFKEGVEKADTGNALKEFFGSMGGIGQPQAASFMKSYQVLKPVIEKLGLQVAAPRSGWIVKKVFKRLYENLKVTRGQPLDELDPFAFEEVFYEGENSFSLNLRFADPEHFTIYAADRKTELGKGMLGAQVSLPGPVKFRLLQTPKNLKIGSFYPFSIGNWVGAAKALRKDLQIVSDKINKSIYDITMFHRNRQVGVRILNELMHEYQTYLKREHDQLAQDQLTYLETKQDQLYGKLEGIFDENVNYLVESLKETGSLGLAGEVESLLKPYQDLHSKVLVIEIELARLNGVEKEDRAAAFTGEGSFAIQINQMTQKIQELKQQRDLFELSLCQITKQSFEERRDELREVREQRYAVEKLLREVDRGEEISSFDLNPGLCLWAKAVHDSEEREDFAEYLENYSRLLSVREKMLQERFFYGSHPPPELEGIDLSTARKLFVEYNTKLNTAEAAMNHYAGFKKELHAPDFELASLSSILKDPLSQKLISDASATGLRLKDEKYRSSKEGERYEEELALQKKILSGHLEQLYKVEELDASLIREKIVGLQKISLDCLNREISVLHEQINDSLKERSKALFQEKKLLEKKMGDILAHVTTLPEKWRLEKWFELKTEIVSNIMKTVTEVVESKTISHHLHRVESKPLDIATLPGLPESPRLYMMAFLGAVGFAFMGFFLSLVRQIIKGFPTSLEKLQALRLPILGSISVFCDGPFVEVSNGPDLDILRRMGLFTTDRKVIGLIGGRGPDYSYALAENLSRMSVQSIILRCDFLSKFRKEEGPGLLQVWKGEIGELPIRKGKGFDYITSGGYTPFGTEIIQSQNFRQLIELLKKNYDRVFLLFRTPLSSAESVAALELCERAVVTVSGEQTEELTPFVTWAYHEDHCRLTFVVRS